MIQISGICKSYKTGDFVQQALDNVSIAFRDSEFVAVLGPSGSGKTTFLNILGGFDRADKGTIIVDGISTENYRDADWDTYRNHRIGFVFQSYNLIPHQTVLANVELALTLSGVGRAERRERALAALDRVGLAEHANKKPNQLSGGQMQRVAIARALVNDPDVVLADEPTGALDTETGVQVMDILAEVARDRLVIMVTHNPQLAHDYATRIVQLTDGRIVDDSNPYIPDDSDAESNDHTQSENDELDAPSEKKEKKQRASMSFLTALALSANNLLTKKGRTFMTAFAGSIGIIGIAAILALSTGVNNYIAKVEEDTLSTYPLSITKQSYDFTGLLTSGTEEADTEASQNQSSTTQTASSDDQNIPGVMVLGDMFASVRSNDLTSFKKFLDEGGLAGDVNAIQYDYGITPLVYSATSAEPEQLSPDALSTAMSSGSSSTTVASYGMSSGVFSEMLDDQELLNEQYDVVAGRWAEGTNEAVLVLGSNGTLTDYTLYGLGILDPTELDSMMDSMMNAEEVQVPDHENMSLSYDDALNLSFKVLSPADVWRKNTETGSWTDMSNDSAYMSQALDNGIDLHIVGIVQPKPTANATALSQGVAYTPELTQALIDHAANSQIVQEQLAHPDIDVFTGKSFEQLREEGTSGLDLSSMFTVDEQALQNAFSFDASALGDSLNLSGFDFSGLNLGSIDIDLSDISSQIDMSSIAAHAPVPDFSAILEGLATDSPLTPEQTEEVSETAAQLVQGFLIWTSRPENGGGLDPTDPNFSSQLGAQLQAYLATDEAQQLLSKIAGIAGDPVRERLEQELMSYVEQDLAPYFTSATTQVAEKLGNAIAQQVGEQLQAQLSNAMGQSAQAYATQLATGMQNALTIDGNAFANAIGFSMTADDLSSMLTSYANASMLTYENNLSTLGYANINDPVSIRIYPINFEAKERVLTAIDAYNDRMEAEGKPDSTITYTDYMGVLMSSVTDIVDMISLVLIAFVSISLVVSSIMIGIITYISVLERRKEIGILRAMGASKRNVASVFNAETFIEGLIAGVFAIAVVELVSIPVNAWVLHAFAVDSIMSLPASAALSLISISVILTVIAGLIPASAASRRDPVEALRSE